MIRLYTLVNLSTRVDHAATWQATTTAASYKLFKKVK